MHHSSLQSSSIHIHMDASYIHSYILTFPGLSLLPAASSRHLTHPWRSFSFEAWPLPPLSSLLPLWCLTFVTGGDVQGHGVSPEPAKALQSYPTANLAMARELLKTSSRMMKYEFPSFATFYTGSEAWPPFFATYECRAARSYLR